MQDKIVLNLTYARTQSSANRRPEASSIMRVLAERSLIGTYLYS